MNDNELMEKLEIYEARRQKLKDLIRLHYRGNKAKFGREVGIDPTSIARMLYPPENKHRKNIGDETIQKIELIHPFWFLPGLAGQLLFLFSKMSEEHQDMLLGTANRYYSEDNKDDRASDPYPTKPDEIKKSVDGG
jgi:hypothetical protein